MSTAAQVQLVFRGEVLPGFDVAEVKRALGERLRTDEQGLARMFSTPRTVLKRAVEPAEAARYIATFARLGAILHAERLEAPPPPAAPAPAKGGFVPLPTIVPPPEEPPAPLARREPPAPAPIRAAAPRPAPPPPEMPATAAAPAAPAALSLVPAGPADTADAGEMVTCPTCGERQTRRLLCRGCTTNIEMALAAKAEAVAASRAAVLAERQRKYGIKAGLEPERTESEPTGLWGVRFEGRMGRPLYWTGSLMSMTVLYLLTLLLIQRPDTGRWILFGIGWLLYLAVSLRWTAMRFHDLNASGWWSVVLSVPYVGQAAGLVLAFVPGTPDDNNYGEPPPEGRWRSVAITGGVLLLTVAVTFSSLMGAVARLMTDDDDDFYEPVAEAPLSVPPGVVSPSARAAFQGDYSQAPPFKAFARSISGPWGWHGGASSLQHAAMQAVQNCNAQRRSDHAPCEIVDARAR